MSETPPAALPRPDRAAARRRALRRRRAGALLRLAAIFALLGLGFLLGDAFGDRPPPPQPLTAIRGVRQVVVTETQATRTVTVVVTAPSP